MREQSCAVGKFAIFFTRASRKIQVCIMTKIASKSRTLRRVARFKKGKSAWHPVAVGGQGEAKDRPGMPGDPTLTWTHGTWHGKDHAVPPGGDGAQKAFLAAAHLHVSRF